MKPNVAAAVALLVGGGTYLFRSADTVAVTGLRALGLAGLADGLHRARLAVSAVGPLPGPLGTSGADAAWGFALGALLAGGERPLQALGLLFVASFELLQHPRVHVVPGTFDPVDLLASLLAYAAAAHLCAPRATSPSPESALP